MAEPLSFKIGAKDDTKNAFNSAKKNIKDYKKEISDLIKKSKRTENPFKKMGKQLKGFTKEFKEINKQQKNVFASFKKMGDAGDDIADTLKNVNREDVIIAEKMAQRGKGMQQQSQQVAQQLQQPQKDQKSQMQSVKLLRVDKIETKDFIGKAVSKKGENQLVKKVSGELTKKIDKNMSEGMQKIGAGIGMGFGGVVAAIGVLYSVMAAKASAFKAASRQQIGGLQQLGFGAREVVPGQKAAGGFYSGYRGVGPGGGEFYLTGQQQVEAMTGFARQTGGNRKQLERMMYGRRSKFPLGALTQAYGLNVGQTAERAGMFERFGQGGSGMQTLVQAMGGAERVGMGGARIKEFLDAMQDAVTQAVYDGSQRSNASMVESLEVLMGTNNERLKAMAPQILRTSTQAMTQAAMLQGGPQGNFMFQAVMSQMKRKGVKANIFDVREQLASGPWLENARAGLQEARRRMGGNENWTAATLAKGLNFNLASPRMEQEMVRLIEKGEIGGKELTRELLEKEITTRIKNTARMLEETVKMDYVESLHTLSDANAKAAEKVNDFREVVQKTIDAIYEAATSRNFFGINLGPVDPSRSGY